MNFVARLIVQAAVASVALGAASALAADLDDQLRLNTAITVTGDAVHMGDIFSGFLSRPEKVVAQAPRPGQRLVLTAEWLNNLARTYGLDWHPANAYDRAIVTQPGQTITPQEILAAVKADLVTKGMPANYSVSPNMALSPVTVATSVSADVGVREAYYDAASHNFSAVVEIPPGDPKAQFVPLRGITYPTVSVPALKDSAPKNTVITAAMLTMIDLPESQIKGSIITDAAGLVGKSPKIFLKSGQPIFETEVAQMSMVDVPVLSADLQRDSIITKDQVSMVTMNSADLPRDAVLDASQLIGRTPRRLLVAGAVIRRGDIEIVRKTRVPVLARDLARGVPVTAADLSWVSLNDNEVVANVIVSEDDIIGRITKRPIRTGQMLHNFDIARPIAVERGNLVTIVYTGPMMNLTVQGQTLEPGGIGDVIRVANTKSKTNITAVVVNAHTVRVTNQQTAMR